MKMQVDGHNNNPHITTVAKTRLANEKLLRMGERQQQHYNGGLLKLFCSYKTELQSLYSYLQSRYSTIYTIKIYVTPLFTI